MRPLLPILFAATAVADEDLWGIGEDVTITDPLPFGHAVHADSFSARKIRCVDCHPVGLVAPEGTPPADMGTLVDPPQSSCHGCHQGALPGAPRGATSTCSTCHPVRSELLPTSHAFDWLPAHGEQARAFGSTCTDCHEISTCVTCHDRRGALAESPHPPGFSSLHGVEARIDPASCTSCHVGTTCTTCHTTGAISQ